MRKWFAIAIMVASMAVVMVSSPFGLLPFMLGGWLGVTIGSIWFAIELWMIFE